MSEYLSPQSMYLKKHAMPLYRNTAVFLLLSGFQLHAKAQEQEPVGKLINSYELEVRQEGSSKKTFIAKSSPSIIIGRSKDNNYRLLMPDSRVVLSKTAPFQKKTHIFSEQETLGGTTQPFSDGSDQYIKWKTVKTTGKIKLTGLIKGPFLSLATDNEIDGKPPSSLTFKNLALYKIKNITVKNIQWNLEALIIPESSKKQTLTSIAFYSGSKNSYLYVINWADKKSQRQYLGYSGILFDGPNHEENIYPVDIPVILEYDVKNIDKDGSDVGWGDEGTPTFSLAI